MSEDPGQYCDPQYYQQCLRELDAGHQRGADVRISVTDTFNVVMLVQLAARHPQAKDHPAMQDGIAIAKPPATRGHPTVRVAGPQFGCSRWAGTKATTNDV